MLEGNRKELDNLMSRFKENLGGLKTVQDEEKTAQVNFMAQYERLKHEVIWPVIVDIGNQLTSYGHDFHVSEEKEFVDATANFRPASLTLNIYPATVDKAFYTPESTPYISFVANRYAKKIGIMVSTMMPEAGGVVGTHGEYDLGEITKEFVESEIVNVLKNTLIFEKG